MKPLFQIIKDRLGFSLAQSYWRSYEREFRRAEMTKLGMPLVDDRIMIIAGQAVPFN
jgi:hypothetical protein